MKKYTKQTLLSLTILALSPLTALADVDDEQAFYIGVGASLTEVDGTDFDFDDSETSLDIRAGYMFTNTIGLEIGYQDYGNFLKGDANFDLDAYSAALVLNLPLSNFDIYGKVGVNQISGDLKVAGETIVDEDATNLFFGAGAEIDMGSLNLFTEYTVTQFDEGDVDADLNRITIGLKLELPN